MSTKKNNGVSTRDVNFLNLVKYSKTEEKNKKITKLLFLGKHMFFREINPEHVHFHLFRKLISYDKKNFSSNVKILGLKVYKNIDEDRLNDVVKGQLPRSIENYVNRTARKVIAQNIDGLVFKAWRFFGRGNDAFIRKFLYVVYVDKNIWRDLSTRTKLIYISLLYEKISGNYDQVTELLKEFIQENGAKPIKNFLPLADFCFTRLGIKEFERQSRIWQFMQTNTFKSVLTPFTNGKTVAVVGNGPSEHGKALGTEIDRHDFVVRFNNFDLTYQCDYGKRVDCWIRGVGADDLRDTVNGEIDVIVFAADFNHCLIRDSDVDFAYSMLLKNKKIVYVASETIDSLYVSSQVVFPTSGLIAIYAMSELAADKIDIYGFNYLDSNPVDYPSHYFNDRTEVEALRRGAPHNFKAESEYLKKITSQRTLQNDFGRLHNFTK